MKNKIGLFAVMVLLLAVLSPVATAQGEVEINVWSDGIQIDDVLRVEVVGNTVHDAGGDGFKLDGTNSATIHDNTIQCNK